MVANIVAFNYIQTSAKAVYNELEINPIHDLYLNNLI